ncbi:MAG: dUTP diphosphatase [Candidatus Glassbacteria bacterium]|nr:dUTP diphosphatase [Candidatus Glassbacteria bacterium]
MTVPFQLNAGGIEPPSYAHPGDAGFDLRASQEMVIPAGARVMAPTGLRLAIPAGHVGLVWDRSGLAAKHGIHCLAGVIDSGYRGEVKVVLQNLSGADFTVEQGMRIAQMLIQPVASAELVRVENLEESPRGEGGFGSTGLQ